MSDMALEHKCVRHGRANCRLRHGGTVPYVRAGSDPNRIGHWERADEQPQPAGPNRRAMLGIIAGIILAAVIMLVAHTAGPIVADGTAPYDLIATPHLTPYPGGWTYEP